MYHPSWFWTRLIGGVLSLATFGLWTAPVWAANLPAYDITPERTRTVTAATSGMATQLYLDDPVYEQLPAGTQSMSTPNVVGNTVYQYTYDTGGTGYLHRFTLPTLTSTQVLADAGSTGHVIQGATTTAAPIPFAVGYSGADNMAEDQASLSSGPYTGSTTSGTQYQGIGVGKYLYTWAGSGYPTAGSHGSPTAYIYGNAGNTDYQVDDSPLITPPVTVSGLNLTTGASVTWQSPMAVVGSWDGGLVATPVNVPSGDAFDSIISYTTSQPASEGGVSGTAHYPQSVADITSDPTWIGAVPGLGSDCVAFGIAGAQHPRVILFNVATGAYKAIGVGTLGIGVSDATVYDQATQTLYVQDDYGALYAFNLAGTLVAHYWPSSWTSGSAMILGQDMALNGSTLYAVGAGGNALGAFSLTLSPDHISTAYGTGLDSPSIVTDSSGAQTVVVSNNQGDVWLQNPSDLFATQANTYHEAVATPAGAPYVGYLADAGTAHDLIGWTNDDPDGDPALVVYVPMPYTMRADLSSTTINSGQSVTIYGAPLPQTVTAHSTHDQTGTTSPVAFEVSLPSGVPVQNFLPMTHRAQGQWVATWTPPANTGTDLDDYIITVRGTDEMGTSASATATLSVNPGPPAPVTNSSGASLTAACGFGAGGLPITVAHSCTLPAWTAGNPPAWFVANPQYGAKFGDTIALSLTVTPPTHAPAPGATITQEHLSASLTYTEGVPNMPGPQGDAPDGQSLYNPNSGTMYSYVPNTVTFTTNGLTGTASLLESWAGYPPDLANANVGSTITLEVPWTLHTTYQWTTSHQACQPPPSNGGPAVCHTVTTHHTQTLTTSGTATTPITVNGTDYYEVATPMGN